MGLHKRKYFLVGLFGPLAILAVACIITVLNTAFSYDGKCGGFFPFLAGPAPCSFWEYVSGTSSSIFIIIGFTYWPLILAFLLVPATIGLILDMKAGRKD